MVPGLLIVAAGLFWAAQLHGDSSYVSVILPAELLIGFGLGWVMAPAMNYATHGVSSDDAGVASATVNTAQQIGASIGTALLNTIATTATATYLATHRPTPAVHAEALAHGFTRGFTVAGVIAVVAALIVAALMNTPRPQRETADTESAVPVPVG